MYKRKTQAQKLDGNVVANKIREGKTKNKPKQTAAAPTQAIAITARYERNKLKKRKARNARC